MVSLAGTGFRRISLSVKKKTTGKKPREPVTNLLAPVTIPNSQQLCYKVDFINMCVTVASLRLGEILVPTQKPTFKEDGQYTPVLNKPPSREVMQPSWNTTWQ